MTISGTMAATSCKGCPDTTTTETAGYTYDLLGRVVTSNQASNEASAQRRFAYDRWGNRTGMWDAVSGGNQIQSVVLQQSGGAPTNRLTSVTTSGVTANYTYDSAGNVTNDGSHTYVYDAENRVVSVDGGATASYSYDVSNQRYKKVTGGATTHYIWQASRVIAEHNGSTGGVVTDYVSFGTRMIANVSGGSSQYFLSDRLSVRMTLDSSGSVLGRQAHLPFGEDFGESGAQEKHHFTSYERDGEAATEYAVNRSYSVSAGRFQQADPYRASGYMLDPRSWNRYSHTRDDPINRTDLVGLQDCPDGSAWIPGTGCYDDQSVDGGTVYAGDGGSANFGNIGGSVAADQPADEAGDEGGEVIDWDALWQRWKEANPCEKKTALSYPFAAFKIIELREQADRWFMDQPEQQRQDNTYSNAVQHCYFSCLATIHLDLPTAKAFGDAHECNSRGNPEGTEGSRHDLHNNEVGRTIGYNLGYDNSDKKCLKKCLASQDLRWLDGNPLPPRP